MKRKASNKKVELEIYRVHNSLGLTISRVNAEGNGDGFRIFGPKLYGQGSPLKTVVLDLNDLERLSDEIKQSIKFLK
jgi:hypothetical protein